jgi:uncharacterized cupredoxin-like copper-binding protein
VLIAGLSTGHKVGIAVMAVIFIGFALISSFVAPRRWPDYPGKGLSVFVVASLVLFALMIGAIEIFGGESEKASAAASEHTVAPKKATLDVSEKEWRITLPSSTAKTLQGGSYTFHVTNDGTVTHNFVVNGPNVSNEKTRDLKPGESADVTVVLTTGTYDLYCGIDGHKKLGMDAKLSVG